MHLIVRQSEQGYDNSVDIGADLFGNQAVFRVVVLDVDA